jgi:hypothetical protein
VGFAQEKLVDEGIAAQVFETISVREYDVSDGNVTIADEPGSAQGWVAKKYQQGHASPDRVKAVAVVEVVFPHHFEQDVGVEIRRDTKCRWHN